MKNHMRPLSLALAFFLISGCQADKQTDPVAAAATGSDVVPQAAPAPVTDPLSLAAGKLSAYSVPAGLVTAGHCSLDAINGGPIGQASLRVGSDATFGGWMADAAMQVPTVALLVLSGAEHSYAVPIKAGVERLDVAKVLASDSLKLSGFNVTVNLSDVAPGTYSANLVHGPAGSQAICAFNSEISVN